MEQSRPQGISYWININLRTVQGRITFAFFLTMLTGAGLIVYNDWNWQRAQAQQSVLVRQIQPIRIESFKLIYLIRETQSDLLRYLYLGKEEFIQKNRQAWLVDIPAQKDTLGHYVRLYKEEEIKNLLTIVNKYLGELKNQQRLIERTLTTNRDPALIQQEFQNDLLFAQTQFEKATQRLIGRVVQAERRLLQKVENEIQTHRSLQIIITLLAFLACYVVGIFLFRQIFLWIRSIRDQLNALQEGYLPPQLPNRSNEFRSIQKHSNALGQSLHRLKEYADAIEQKDFQANLDVFSPNSPLGMALNKMQDTLRQISREEQERTWNNERLAEMSEILRLYTHDIQTLCQKLVQQLVESLEAVQGGIFILRKPDNAPPYFELLASYAYGRHKFTQHQVKTDEGLLGRIYHEREQVYLEELPPDYSLITSGLGNASPRALILMPLKNEEKAILGAVELSFMQALPDYQQSFLSQFCNNFSTTLTTALNYLHNQQLLLEAQQASQSLKEKEDEARKKSEALIEAQQQIEMQFHEVKRENKKLNGVLANISEGVIITDAQGRIEGFNQAAEQLFGWQADDLQGKNTKILISPMYAAEHDQYIKNHLEGKGGNLVNKSRKLEARHKNGAIFPIYLTLHEAIIDEEHVFVAVVRPVEALETNPEP